MRRSMLAPTHRVSGSGCLPAPVSPVLLELQISDAGITINLTAELSAAAIVAVATVARNIAVNSNGAVVARFDAANARHAGPIVAFNRPRADFYGRTRIDLVSVI